MKRLIGVFTTCLSLATMGCVAQQAPEPAVAASPVRVILVAGDRSDAVFDHATQAFAANLAKRGIPEGAITRLSADPAEISKDGVRTASVDLITSQIAALHPGPKQACLVFATSHGAKGQGLYLSTFKEFLTPAALDTALERGCGPSPTVVIVSACYSGNFTQAPMTRPTRVVLTAARADRQSFGCGAGLQYTYFDECLLDAVDHASEWQAIASSVTRCVGVREQGGKFRPSEPQAFFGREVANLALPTR